MSMKLFGGTVAAMVSAAGIWSGIAGASQTPDRARASTQALSSAAATGHGASYTGVFTTMTPGAPTGYRARLHFGTRSATDPTIVPVRTMRFTLAPGFKIDTGVPLPCRATDSMLRRLGKRACPRASQVGVGSAVVVSTAPGSTLRVAAAITLFGVKGGQIVLVTARGTRAVLGVTRVKIRGRTFTVHPPTCVTGGQPPRCATDQLALVTYRERLFTVIRNGHPYRTTPRVCPTNRHWTNHVTLTYANGTVRRLTSPTPCRRGAR